MATLSRADKQNLNADQQKQILALKDQWAAANAAGNTADMEKAHKAAEAIRASSTNGAYSGGIAGNSYASKSNGGGNPYMSSNTANGNATLGSADNALLNASQQQQIANLKAAWAQANAANDQGGMDAAHQQAEAIRKAAGYSGGASGVGYSLLGANAGGMTSDQMKDWLEDYMHTNYKTGSGWTNGYSTAMNVRSKANKIRQQMLANEQAQAGADDDTKNYLHKQNLALADLLYQYAGHSNKTTWYNEEKGRWETMNPDVGYGYYAASDDPRFTNDWKKWYGYTDEDIQRYANDTGLYYNFVDPSTVRLATDESSGYTGKYSQFVNGPYAQLLGGGTHDGSVAPEVYMDIMGDGFGDEAVLARFTPIRDENGNVLNAKAPQLKNNNAMSDYTNQFTAYTQNGIIQPGILSASHPGGGSSHGGVQKGTANGMYSLNTNGYVDASDPRYTGGINRDVAASTADDPNNSKGQLDYYWNYGQYSKNAYNPSTAGGGGTYEDYINQMYSAALQSQLANLESSYKQNISDLDAERGSVDDSYTEQKRQTTGTAAQEAANWREMANAYGLNSGAIGQAGLAQSNQLQGNLNTLESAQAAAQAEIERNRTLLGQQYQLQINQAIADNDFNRANALYQEAVRADEALREQQQFNANMALQYAQLAQQQSQFDAEMALSYAKAAGKSGSNGAGYIAPTGGTEGDMYAAILASGMDPETWLSSKTNRKQFGFGDYDAELLTDGYYNWETTNTMPTAEFNQFMRTAQAYATANQRDKLNEYLSANEGRLSYEQGVMLNNQLSKWG